MYVVWEGFRAGSVQDSQVFSNVIVPGIDLVPASRSRQRQAEGTQVRKGLNSGRREVILCRFDLSHVLHRMSEFIEDL